ncbi:hypothetical protein KAR91_03975 [Candidatus Pacearchaeota archaeon]|nr:hypothetical protein [Candidatus Pacearchaeota archaeon]
MTYKKTGNNAITLRWRERMKKWFLSFLAMIVMVGTMFTPSNACNHGVPEFEACYLLSYSAEGYITTDIRVAQTADQNYSTFENHNIIFTKIHSKEVPGVSCSNVSWTGCPVINPEQYMTINGSNIRSEYRLLL